MWDAKESLALNIEISPPRPTMYVNLYTNSTNSHIILVYNVLICQI